MSKRLKSSFVVSTLKEYDTLFFHLRNEGSGTTFSKEDVDETTPDGAFMMYILKQFGICGYSFNRQAADEYILKAANMNHPVACHIYSQELQSYRQPKSELLFKYATMALTGGIREAHRVLGYEYMHTHNYTKAIEHLHHCSDHYFKVRRLWKEHPELLQRKHYKCLPKCLLKRIWTSLLVFTRTTLSKDVQRLIVDLIVEHEIN